MDGSFSEGQQPPEIHEDDYVTLHDVKAMVGQMRSEKTAQLAVSIRRIERLVGWLNDELTARGVMLVEIEAQLELQKAAVERMYRVLQQIVADTPEYNGSSAEAHRKQMLAQEILDDPEITEAVGIIQVLRNE